MIETLRDLLEGTIEDEAFKIYQPKPCKKEEYLELDMSKEQALSFLSETLLNTPARFTNGYYGINYVELLFEASNE